MAKQQASFVALSQRDEDRYVEIMAAYRDTAKEYTKLASAGLILPVVLSERVLGPRALAVATHLWLTALFWLLFLIAIGLGLLYQYFSVRYLCAQFWSEDWDASWWIHRNPGWVYGSMLIAFYAGAVAFVALAWASLF